MVPMSINRLIDGIPDDLKGEFVGGTGLSCVLMPNTYHHYHSPVDGEVVYVMKPNEDGTFGSIDFANWVPTDGNVARPGADFSQFENYQRAAVIIKVTYDDYNGNEVNGYVATIPVGLESIRSVELDDAFRDWSEGEDLQVQKGVTRIGHFKYGGSLNIILFSKDLSSAAVQTRMGNQITLFNTGEAPDLNPPIPWAPGHEPDMKP